MEHKEIPAAYRENHMKQMYVFCGQNTEAMQLVLKCENIYNNTEIKTTNTGKHFN